MHCSVFGTKLMENIEPVEKDHGEGLNKMAHALKSGIYHTLGREEFTSDRQHQSETSKGRDAACDRKKNKV